MALQEAILAIRFAGGVETKEDDKHVALTKLLGLENGVFTRNATIGTRNGYEEMPGARIDAGTNLPAARAVGQRGDELLVYDDSAGYAYVSSASAWKKAGDIVCPTLSHAPLVQRTEKQTLGDHATLDGVTLIAWVEPDGVWIAVRDASTGRLLLEPEIFLASGSNPRVFANDYALQVVCLNSASRQLQIGTVSPSNPGTVTSDVLAYSLHATYQAFDVATGGDRAAIAFYTDTNVLRIGYVHPSGGIGSPATSLPSVVDVTATVAGAISVAVQELEDFRVSVAYFDGADLRRALRNADLDPVSHTVIVAGTTGLRRLGTTWGGTDPVYAWDEDDSGTRVAHWVSYSVAGTLGTERTLRKSSVVAKPYTDGDYTFIPVVFESTLYTTAFVVRSDGLIVARILSGISGDAPAADSLPGVAVSGSQRALCLGYKNRLSALNRDEYTEPGLQLVTLDHDASDSHQHAELGRTAYVAGAGFLWQYDGEGYVEQGFHYGPDDVATPVQDTASSGGVDVGTHLYRFAYGWRNAQGELEWGPVSAGTEVTVAGSSDNEITFSIPTIPHTEKTDPRGEVFVGVFRGLAGDEQLLYLVSATDPTATGENGYVVNDPSADTVSFVDTMTDAVAATKERIYTTGGVLSNDPTPSGQILATAQERLAFSDPGDPDVVRMTQVRRDGYAAEAAPELVVRLSPRGGDLKALAEMDGSIYAFKERAIYRISGPGPSALGTDGFAPPALIHTDVGCKDQRCLAIIPPGIMFWSEKGWRLLDRREQVHYIGGAVERYTDPQREPLTFVSATVIPDRNEVRCLSSDGVALYYDYSPLIGDDQTPDPHRWSTWANHTGVAAAVVGGAYYYVRPTGEVYKETSGLHLDVNRNIDLGLITAWVKLAGYLQGLQRVWTVTVVGRFKGVHSVRCRFAYDYEEGWTDDIAIDSADFISEDLYGEGTYDDGPYGGSSDTRYQFEVHVDEECEAMRIWLQATRTSPSSAGTFEVSEILVHGGVAARRYTLAPERMT